MTGSDDGYLDHPVRHYVITDGRAHPSRNTLRPETLVRADPTLPIPMSVGGHKRGVLRLCSGVLSLAEVAAHLGLPVSVVAVVVSDLIDSGYLSIHSGPTTFHTPDRHILEKVLDGLRAL